MHTNTIRTYLLFVSLAVSQGACSLQKDSDAEFQKASYRRAMTELQAAKNELDRFYSLGYASLLSLNQGQVADAQTFADELERITPKYKNNWNYPQAVEKYNIVLGRIALKKGDVESAKKRLLAAGRSPGSRYSGPNTSLASDLLVKNESAVVLEYFELCRKCWQMDNGRLDLWRHEVENGRLPYFGANLYY